MLKRLGIPIPVLVLVAVALTVVMLLLAQSVISLFYAVLQLLLILGAFGLIALAWMFLWRRGAVNGDS